MAWDKRYRQLSQGEVIREGDEVQCDDATWIPARSVGLAAPDPCYTSHRVYRRALVYRRPQPPTRLQRVLSRANLIQAACFAVVFAGSALWSNGNPYGKFVFFLGLLCTLAFAYARYEEMRDA